MKHPTRTLRLVTALGFSMALAACGGTFGPVATEALAAVDQQMAEVAGA